MFRSAATKIAHNSTIPALAGNQDLRPLQDLITAEKAVIISLQRLSADFSKASEALKSWGLGEGDDLGNILNASTAILTHFTSALSQYASHGHTMREQLKAIRTREENLDELKRRRRGVMSKADSAERKLHKMSPEHKNLVPQTDLLNKLREEIRGLDVDIMRDEAAIGDFKRSATRSWLGLKFGGLLECCEKGVIAGEYGKLVVTEIPEDETQPGLPRSPYYGHTKVEELVAEAHRCVNEVRLSTVPSTAQPRRTDQQLPQVPNVSESPFMNQGSFTSSPYQQQPYAVDTYNDDVSRRDVLPEPQGFSTGRFLDSPVEGSPSPFAQSQHQSQYSGSLSSASAFQSQSGRRVDEFGSTIDAPSAGGGRFATFPVKARSDSFGTTGSGYPKRADDKDHDAPLSLLSAPERGQSDSFSSSVAQALAASSGDQKQNFEEPALGKPGRYSKDGPAPAYESPIDSESNPWGNSSSVGARLGPNDNQLISGHSRQTSDLSGDEALLAYMTSPPTTVDTQGQLGVGGVGGVDDKHVSRHVRFGTVSQIDDAPLPPMTPQDSSFSPSPDPVGVRSGAQTSLQGQGRGESFDGQDTKEVRIAAPMPVNSQDHERALNAAAAREIALEFTSSPPTIQGPPTETQHPPTSGPDPSHLSRELPPSPLVPPTASYMSYDRKSVSPRPEFNVPSTTTSATATTLDPSPAPSYTEEPPLSQQYSGASFGSVSAPTQQLPPSPYLPTQTSSRMSSDVPQRSPAYTSQPLPSPRGAQGTQGTYMAHSPYEQEYNPYEEQSQKERSRGYSTSSAQAPISPPPPQINFTPSTTTHSPPHNTSATPYSYYNQPSGGEIEVSPVYQSPILEQPPNAPYMRSGIGNRGSNSSLNSTGGGGKISAAAFKRPSPRLGGGGTSPFGPPSPTPFSNSGGNTMKSPTEGKKLPSPWDSEPVPPGYRDDRGGQARDVQPLKINKRQTQELDVDQYDYISAYVNSGGPEDDDNGGSAGVYYSEQAQRAANANSGGGGWAGIGSGGGGAGAGAGGYGQGRFATNLEDESGLR